jgi:hypothetical protein
MLKIYRKQVDRVRTYRTVFNSEDGKKVLHDLMRTHHVIGGLPAKDPYEMYRAEGERNVVLRILSLLNIDPIQFEKHLKDTLQSEADNFKE